MNVPSFIVVGETSMLRTTSIITSLTMLTIVVSLTPLPCLAGIQGDVELLKTVALQHKANFESILTWKGEAFEERTSTIGNWFDSMIKNKCTFAYDQLQDAVRWNKEPQESRCINHGEPQTIIHANYNSAMFKDQSYYEYTGFEQPDDKNKVVYHLAIGEPKMASGKQNHGLDPRYLFADAPGAPIHGKLMFLYNNANDERASGWSVKREGDLVTLQISPDETRTQKEVYDLSAGGNLVEYYNKTPTAEITKSYTYEEKSGVWVLKSFKKTNIAHRKNGDVHKITRTINWSNSVVNVPFEEDEFTVEKLGVKHGDLISDHKIGIGYIYGGFLRDSEMLDVLDTTDVPEGMIAPKNSGINETTDQTDATVKMDSANDVDTEAEKDMLQIPAATSTGRETNGTSTYIYIIIFAIIIGLAGIAYKLTRRFRKE